MHSFKVGDRVRRKWGGPVMMVYRAKDMRLGCEWWDNLQLTQQDFEPEVLVLVPEPNFDRPDFAKVHESHLAWP